MKLAFEADKENGKPCLLLIHGFLVSRRVWFLNSPLRQHFRLVLVDLPGHGASPAPETLDDYMPSQIARSLETIRNEIGIERWHVCGQSFGGAVALWYTYQHPSRVITVSLTNANMAIRDDNEFDRVSLAERAKRIRSQSGSGVREERFHPAYAKRMAPELRRMLAEDADGVEPAVAANFIEHALCEPLGLRILEIERPLMLVNGIFERDFQPLRDRFQVRRPDAEIVDLEGGHAINLEMPDGFNDAMVRFALREHQQRRSCSLAPLPCVKTAAR